MNSVNLSSGDLRAIFTKQERYNNPIDGVYQIYNTRKTDGNQTRKSLVMLSDGKYNVKALLRHDAAAKYTSLNVQKGDIIKVLSGEPAVIRERKKFVFLIDDFEVLQSGMELVNPSCEFLDTYLINHPDEVIQGASEDSTSTTNSNSTNMATNSAASANPAPKINKPATNSSQFDGPIFAIEQLSPYQNAWTIKARISFKGNIKEWRNQRGDGKLLNFNFLDSSGEIRATCFNDLALKYNEELEEGKVYKVSKARLQPSKPQFSNLSHPYELSIDNDTIIQECQDEDSVPKNNFNFVKLDSIQYQENNSTIDVLGIIKVVNPYFELTSRAGKKFDRRDIEIVDDTGYSVTVGLWNKQALDFDIPVGSVIAIKGVRVTDFGGKSLSMGFSSMLLDNPEIEDAYDLKSWYNINGDNSKFISLKQENGGSISSGNLMKLISQRLSIGKAKADNLGRSDKGDFFSVKANISFLKVDNFAYPACNNEGCNKKVIELNDGSWRCEKCDQNFPAPQYRYMLTISIMDETDQIWLTLFNDQAQQLLGVDANTLMELKENNPDEFAKTTQKIQMNPYDFRIRAREDTYNEQTRIRYTVSNLHELKYKVEADYLAEELSKGLVF